MAVPGLRDADAVATGRRRAFAVLAGLAVVAAVVLLVAKPLPQPLAYHAFSDGNRWLGIPNALNVLSNLPFLLIGLAGLRHVSSASAATLAPQLRGAYLVTFAGIAVTAFGSAYYHWAPGNATLVWDRLPIAVAFMGLFAATVGERISLGWTPRVLPALVALGVASVLWWAWRDDLRFYGIVQFYPLLAIPLLVALCPSPYSHGSMLYTALGCYIAAKALEEYDHVLHRLLGVVSGHTLKHLAAAAGAWLILSMLMRRRPVG